MTSQGTDADIHILLLGLRRTAWVVRHRVALWLGISLALPLRLLQPLYRIEVQPLLIARIGHLAIEPELLLAQREVLPSTRTRTIFYSPGAAANHHLLAMWKRVLPTGPWWLLEPIYRAGKEYPWLNVVPQEWDTRHVDLRCLDVTRPHLVFTDEEELRGQLLLRNLGLPPGSRYVCLAVRDSAYLDVVDPHRDWSYHSFRDSDVRTFHRLAVRLADLGYHVIRMGALARTPFDHEDARIVDYAFSAQRSDFGDVYLFAHCDFCITTSTGMDSLAMAFRRPMGLANLASVDGLQLGSGVKLVMFKDAVDAKTGESLRLTAPRRALAMSVVRTQELEPLSVALVPNSPEELEQFAEEMVQAVEGRLTVGPQHRELEDSLIASLAPGEEMTHRTFTVSPSWLQGASERATAD